MEEICELIKNGYECEYLDFKAEEYSKNNKEELIRDIMAMANAKHNGDKFIIIGIKVRADVKEVVGIQSITDSSEYQELIHSNIEPEINFDYFPLEFEGKLLGIIRIYGNDNRPYMMKRDFGGCKRGLCLIRKGSKKGLAARSDFDQFYSRKMGASFKAPNSSERKLSLRDGEVLGIVQNGTLLRNVGDSIAYNTEIHLFLDVLITHQAFILAGDIPPMGEVSIEKLDNVIKEWKHDIAKVMSNRYAGHISHRMFMLIQFKDEAGDEYAQVIEAGIAWSGSSTIFEISYGCGERFSKPKKTIEKCGLQAEKEYLFTKWRDYVSSRDYDSLEGIDFGCRDHAIKFYFEGFVDSYAEVNEIFDYCNHAQMVGRALKAMSLLPINSKKNRQRDIEQLEKLQEWLIDGANALHKHYFKEPLLEELFWKHIGDLEVILKQ